MNVLLRCVVLALAAFGITFVVASMVTAARWAFRRPTGPAAWRADSLLRLRLQPALWALGILVFSAVGLYRFESRDGDELLGGIFWLLGASGAALLLVGVGRVALMQWRTARLTRAWMADATPLALSGLSIPAYAITTGYPVVAVTGVLRPRLVIDRLVLRVCTAPELDAILAHERGHVRRRDNLRRLAFATVPGSWGAPGLARAWRDATEEAADDLAATGADDARFHLATALLRVSRLAPPQDGRAWQAQLPASALYRGDSIEHRVRRLVDGPEAGHHLGRSWAAALGLMLLTAAFVLQHEIHDAMEVVVAVLP